MNQAYLIIAGGVILFALLLFQLATGLRWLKVPMVWHKRVALLIIFLVFFHMILGLSFLLS